MSKYINKITYQFDIVRRYDHYIGTTNFKIGLLLSFIVAILVAIVLRAISVLSAYGELTGIGVIASTICVLTILASAIYLVRAVSPSVSTASYRSYIFFGDVASWDGGEQEYYSMFSAESEENLLKDICFQTHAVAKVTNEKFRLISVATKIILFGVIPSFAANIIILILGC